MDSKWQFSNLAKKAYGNLHYNFYLHNNVGYSLGNQAIVNGWSEEELLNQVINAANNGELKIGL